MLKSLELALSSELGALRVSWEVYMKKVTIKSEMEMDGRSSRQIEKERADLRAGFLGCLRQESKEGDEDRWREG